MAKHKHKYLAKDKENRKPNENELLQTACWHWRWTAETNMMKNRESASVEDNLFSRYSL